MDLDDINPIAVVMGIIGALIGVIILKYGGMDLNLFWKVLTPICCGIASFLIVQKMAE